MIDSDKVIQDKFFNARTKPLNERFPGFYRALVIETNDPLNMMRVRIKCPDMHDFDLAVEDCPWAVPAFELGGYRAGSYAHPCIGDWVWITFEKQHPYAPVWTGFANPTRRKAYTYPQISTRSPVSLNQDGKPTSAPADYDDRYLPKDGRPMYVGTQDRYGNLDLMSAVGYYPTQHESPPPPPDHDAVQRAAYKQEANAPKVNSPDKKYMARVTKYGNMLIMGDQGYLWKKNGNIGEFTGNFEQDEDFETKRWLYIQRLINEDQPDTTQPDSDQRRMTMLTRYGHRIECRDVGWAQIGPVRSTTRDGEYSSPTLLSQEEKNDYRWIKIRTKGGMLFQAYDKGFNPQEDEFIKRKLIDEQGAKSEEEDIYWKNKDARWIRTVTRYGLKIVLDDRGTDDRAAHTNEKLRANGILIKGRRTPAAGARDIDGDPRGFYWEFNENDKANHTSWGSPLGQSVEINDRYQYIMISSSLGKQWAAQWQGLKENEFIRKPMMLADPEATAHHLKIDHENEYIRLKTRAGGGPAPDGVDRSGVSFGDIQQGLEARDTAFGDGPWLEMVDSQNRGIWWSKKYALGIWRASRNNNMYMWMSENNNTTVVYNDNPNGKIIIYSSANIEVISNNNIDLQAQNTINMRAQKIKMSVAPEVAATAPLVRPNLPSLVTPTDRAKTYNGPFDECPLEEVEHPIS